MLQPRLAPLPAATSAGKNALPRLFIRLNRRIYPEVRDYLVAQHDFVDLPLLDSDDNPLSTWGRCQSAVRSLVQFARNLRLIRGADVIVAAPKNVNVILKILARLGLIRPRKNFCYGFFSHSIKALAWFRWLAKLDSARDIYIVFSEEEAQRYGRALDVPSARIPVLPYSDWDQQFVRDAARFDPASKTPRYYFSGGFSNRDYLALIDVFRPLRDKLIIVCSAINTEFAAIELPANVEVRRDLPIAQFDSLIGGATACILPIKDKTSVAGQSVVVNCLKHYTPVIITDTPVVREYIEHGVSGYLVQNMTEVPALLATLDPHAAGYREMVTAGYKVYLERYSYQAVAARFDEILGTA